MSSILWIRQCQQVTYDDRGLSGIQYGEEYRAHRGADYASPVSFWMPFNGGVGFHDATWRSSFGGTIYQYNGSPWLHQHAV